MGLVCFRFSDGGNLFWGTGMKGKMKRVITITYNDLGISWGPAIHFLELWNNFARINQDITVVGISPSWTKRKCILNPLFRHHSIEILDVKGVRQIIYDFRVFLYILRYTLNDDIIYIRYSSFHLFTILYLILSNRKFVVEINGLAFEDLTSARTKKWRIFLFLLQESLILKKSKLIITVSDGIKNTIRGRYEILNNIFTIRNGISDQFSKQNEIKQQLKSIIYVGTFTPWDGSYLIPKLAEKFPDINFILIGSGLMKNKIESLGLTNINCLGEINYSDLPKYYDQVDAALVLYEYERHRNIEVSSIKTLEYFYSKLPVFTTNIPGQEFIATYDIGYLIGEFEPIEQAFRNFINNYMTYNENYLKLNVEIFDNYSWKRTAELTYDLLREF